MHCHQHRGNGERAYVGGVLLELVERRAKEAGHRVPARRSKSANEITRDQGRHHRREGKGLYDCVRDALDVLDAIAGDLAKSDDLGVARADHTAGVDRPGAVL